MMRRAGVPLPPDERRSLSATLCGGCAWRAVPAECCAGCGYSPPAIFLLAGACQLALCRFCESQVLTSRRDAEQRGAVLAPLHYLPGGEPLPPVHVSRVRRAAEVAVAMRRAGRQQRRQRRAARLGTTKAPPAPSAVA